ncbi:MAG: penicillin-binding transpeptidase domain-containing protein [Eubacteriales bacterium]
MGYIVYYQVVESSSIINSPYNSRQDIMAEQVVRGDILDSNGVVLAETIVAEDGTETRNYPLGEMAVHAIGYDVKGKAGVELAANFSLLTSNAFFVEKITNDFQDEKYMGDSVITTIDAELQVAAYNALGDFKGAAFVMEPDTGKILAMVSKTSFDPNTVSENWDSLTTDENSSLLNRATQSSMVPGSVFKIVTALEYMRENPDYESYTYECTGCIEVDGVKIECYNGTAHGVQTLEEAFANSCNSAFVDMGLSIDNDELYTTAESLLFNTSLPGSVTSTKSSFVLDSSSELYETMMTAMGQGDTLTSPYHMALITAAIANGGKLMTPYIIDSIENYTGDEVKNYSPSAYGNLMTSTEAEILSQYMQAVVSYGTGTDLSGASYTVAGKTGTAEYSSDKSQSHSWFVGFTNVDNPDIVVSVVLEQSDGEGKAITVAKKIMDAYYQ